MKSKANMPLQYLRWLSRHITANGYAPSLRDFGRGMGCSSTGSVRYYLAKLEADGLVVRTPGKARAIRITRRGAEALRAAGE